MPQKLAYSVPEKWPTEPELSVSEGDAVLRIPPPPRWQNIVQIIASGLLLVLYGVPIVLVLWLAMKHLGIRSAIVTLASSGIWLLYSAICLAGSVLVLLEIRNIARFGKHGGELRARGRELRYCRATSLRGVRTSIWSADDVVDFRTEAVQELRGKTRTFLHIRLRRRLPIRRVMKTSDSSLPAKVESAFREALGT